MSVASTRRRVSVHGVVQGVGFRPFVHRLATELGLGGFVGNDARGVFVEVKGSAAAIEAFCERLVSEAPPLAVVEGIELEDVPSPERGIDGQVEDEAPFRIVASRATDHPTTLLPPDVAVCDACLAEVLDPADRRYRYPFANCTSCGPRFTIIEGLPYDRPATTMAGFDCCPECAAEYADPTDRRYHAQPIACPACGPQVAFRRGDDVRDGTDDVLRLLHEALAAGEIVAVKGIGGYHLACDATDDGPLGRLRERKGRGEKPFAVMAGDLTAAAEIAELGAAEIAALTSTARPIVLCRRRPGSRLARLVAPSNHLVGVMLPYTPLHHLIFRPVPGSSAPVPRFLVLTSGNRSDEPICYDDAEALVRLGQLADAFLTHDRPIGVPCDDSVIRVVDDAVVPLRRSRGYAPLPVRLPVAVRPTLAFGGELKTTFCVAEGHHAWLSQHIGDLGNLETLETLERQVAAFQRIYGTSPEVHAVDLHPGYRTHRLAAERSLPGTTEVQHHHAHVAAVMAEHGLDGSSPVVGLAFDGTGFGVDRAGVRQIWGGEVLVADYGGFERVGHLEPLPLPGGDASVRNPCRIAVAYLTALGLPLDPRLPAVEACGSVERSVVARQVEKGVGCVPTSSMGRLFDAVSSLCGIRHRVTYEAQAAIELEAAAEEGLPSTPLRLEVGDDGVIGLGPLLGGIVEAVLGGARPSDVALGFHVAVADAALASVERVAAGAGQLPVVLTGGVFQNALLTHLVRRRLAGEGYAVLTHRVVPPNDGGLALGQAVIAGLERS